MLNNLSTKIGNAFSGFFDKKSTELTYDQLADLIDGQMGFHVAGVSVNRKTALQVAAVLACVKVIAEGCSTPDLHVHRELEDDKSELAKDIPEYRLLCKRPNEYQTSFEWRRMMTAHAVLVGAGLSIKVRSFIDGTVKELLPISPGNWTMYKTGNHDRRYRVFDESGLIGDFSEDDVFLLKGLEWDFGDVMDAVKLARNVLGLSIATEKNHIDQHNNGVKAPGFYSIDGKLGEEQYKQLLGHVKRTITSGDPLIVDDGGKWNSLSMTGVDAQHIETRRFQIEEVCRVFNVYPQMIMHTEKNASNASVESFFKAHFINTLSPWHKNWNTRIDETILDGSGPLFTKFDVRYMLQGSTRDRAIFIRTVAEMGVYTRNEIRQEEGKDSIDGLDEPLTPLNMTKSTSETDDDND